jgi:hypothetical protein
LENLLQRSRFELKYIIGEPTAHEIRHFARSHLMPDSFADPKKGYSYEIHSVYLDNPGQSLMNQTLEGLKNRFKLRVRFYDANPDHPVFFEVKRRVNDAIIKVRAKVRREAADRLMRAHHAWPSHADLANPSDDRGFVALCKFCELRDKMDAAPQVLVSYNREAWCAPEDDSIRVTFDRNLEGAAYDPDRTFRLFHTEDWVRPPMKGVVLELKFTDRFPNWMRQMAQTFNLQRTSMAKYVTCAKTITVDGVAAVRQAAAERELVRAQRWEQERRLGRERAAAQGQTPAAAPPQAPKPAPVPAAGVVPVPVAIPVEGGAAAPKAWPGARHVAL